jgi:uncharacterized protein (TIGR03435 family)
MAAQTQPDTRARFDVASVKPSPESGGRRSPSGFPPGKVVLMSHRLKTVIPMAYGVQPFLVFGGPEWLQNEPYDIVGELSVNGGVPPPSSKTLEALQVLLEERFKLRFHKESRIMPLYTLAVAKGGTKLVDGDDLPADTKRDSPDRGVERLLRRKAPMSNLATALSFFLQTPVDNRTGLTGLYSFVLGWRNEEVSADPPGPGIPQTDVLALNSALRAQLGLELQKGKGPVDVMVIDSAERPSAN